MEKNSQTLVSVLADGMGMEESAGRFEIDLADG